MNTFASKNKEKNSEYYVGLDVGTGSVGWCVTDTKYNVIKIGKQSLWGSRLFSTAKTAEDRRLIRCARRRVQRAKERISLLQTLFNEEIAKVDSGFFVRLQESALYQEDKSNNSCKYSLFNDTSFTDKEFYAKYPTIYHLRSELMESAPDDIRLLYLAVAHIIKNRGHFLFNNFSVKDSASDLKQLWMNCVSDYSEFISEKIMSVDSEEENENNSLKDDLYAYLADKYEEIVAISFCSDESKRKELSNKLNLSVKDAITQIASQEVENKDVKNLINSVKSFYSFVQGCSVTESKLLLESSSEDNIKLDFSKADFETSFLKLDDEKKYVVDSIKHFYDLIVLKNILGNESSISKAKVELYENHKKELLTLKNLVKKYLTSELLSKICDKKHMSKTTFKELLFSSKIVRWEDKELNSFYSNLIHSSKSRAEAINSEFYKKVLVGFATTVLSEHAEDLSEYETYLLNSLQDIEKSQILKRLKSIDNAVVPYQLQQYELNKILDKAKSKYAFLNETSEGSLSIAEKINSILEFRIPYYVGPLNKQSKYAWIVRKEGKITPWNFNEKVDLKQSASNFIERMTCNCSILRKEKVLPKNSILYSKFMVLNFLNNIRINNQKLSDIKTGLVEEIYTQLFCCNVNVTIKKLSDFLSRRGLYNKDLDLISGIDVEQALPTMSSYVELNLLWEKYTNIYKTDVDKISFFEDAIRFITLFTQDGDFVKEKLLQIYPSLNTSLIEAVSKKKYKDWGALSKKLLSETFGYSVKNENEIKSVIDFMLEGRGNLQELISSNQWSFMTEISKKNSSELSELNFSYKSLVADLYASPSVKRMIWQALLIIREISHKIMGYSPKKIFVEMARDNQDNGKKGKRSFSRKNQILNLYKNIKEEMVPEIYKSDFKFLYGKINEKDNKDIVDKLYLYFSQFGRCMYSGKKIELDDLFNRNTYDIDHIIPQSLTKDDSLNNKVLVCKINNLKKLDDELVPEQIRKNSSAFWRVLKDNKLITSEKFSRLVRSTPYSDSEKAGFIQRQLVETRQSTKLITEILSQLYSSDNTEIVFSKADLVARFKRYFNLPKVRQLNNLHHAKDAYCNIVVGNVYHEKFTKDFYKFVKSKEKYSFEDDFRKQRYLFTDFYQTRLQKLGVWDARNEESISIVKKYYSRNNILLTIKQADVKGALFDQTIYPKSPDLINKKKDLESSKYGGYKKPIVSSFSIVTYEKNDTKMYSFVPILLNEIKKNPNSDEIIKDFVTSTNNITNLKILVKRLPIPVMMREINSGYKFLISGMQNHNTQLILKNFNSLTMNIDMQLKLQKIITAQEKIKKQLALGKTQEDIQENYINLNEDLLLMIVCFREKIETTCFKKLPDSFISALRRISDNDCEIFNSLNIIQKIDVVISLLKEFQNEGGTIDLEVFKKFGFGSAHMGLALIPAKLDIKSLDINDYEIVYQSVTGFYEKTLRIKDLL